MASLNAQAFIDIRLRLLSFLLVCITVAPVSAQTVQSDRSTDQAGQVDQIKHLYRQAKKAFEAKEHEKAHSLFTALVQKAPQSRTFNFYLGRSAFEISRYEDAIVAFDRVLMLEPNHLRTRLEMARVYFALKQYEMALLEVKAVLANPDAVPPNVQKNAKRFVAVINSEMDYSPHSHSFTLVLGGEYDSNVNNDLGSSGSFELPGLNDLVLEGRKEVEDYALSQTFLYDYGYDFGERKGWHWQTKVLGLNKNHRETSQNDLQYLSIETGLGLKQSNGRWLFPLTLDRVYLDGETYVSNVALGIEYERAVTSKLFWTAGYTGRVSEYESNNKARNALSHLVSLSTQKISEGETPWVLGLEAKGESRRQRETHPTDPASMQEYRLRASVTKVIDSDWRVNSGFMRRWTNYDFKSALFENQRADRVNRFNLGVTYQMAKTSQLSFNVSRAIHDSNQGLYHYDKDRAALRYILQF
ncbi:M48 family metallopeptidase [Thiomicrospira sp. WB1]|uniref:tetratricopeptide repeat protein n=1 Tax=Thiomicrospira sp. WB1 TaxID=1685380 RepID=UPI00074AE3E0|nr:tetratricopeptide repeat protein [Thiomicrospira sp. WB1]KUJ72689.1 hypothetical protein AVO41_02505 [Thiomicrospira sp. WB1]